MQVADSTRFIATSCGISCDQVRGKKGVSPRVHQSPHLQYEDAARSGHMQEVTVAGDPRSKWMPACAGMTTFPFEHRLHRAGEPFSIRAHAAAPQECTRQREVRASTARRSESKRVEATRTDSNRLEPTRSDSKR